MDNLIQQISILFPQFDHWFSAGFIVFARLLGFVRFAPIFNRKEIAGLVKLAFVFILTIDEPPEVEEIDIDEPPEGLGNEKPLLRGEESP